MKPSLEKGKEIDGQITKPVVKPLTKAEKIKLLIQNKNRTLADIKEAFGHIDNITLYSGKIIQGAILTRGAVFSILTVDGTTKIKGSEIKSVKVKI